LNPPFKRGVLLSRYIGSTLAAFGLLVLSPIDAHGGGHGGGGHGGGGGHHGGGHNHGGGFHHGGVFISVGGFYPGYWGLGYGPGYWGYDYYPPTYAMTAPPVIYQAPPSNYAYPPTPIPKESLPPPSQKTPVSGNEVKAGAGTSEERNAGPLLTLTNAIPVSNQAEPQVDSLIGQLTLTDDATRIDAAIQLGRMKAGSAVAALSNVLTQDANPMVRDSAARALGLIGSPEGLSALIRAALGDDSREVRRSSQFAVDVIRWNLHGK
jgi:hypothetical protein